MLSLRSHHGLLLNDLYFSCLAIPCEIQMWQILRLASSVYQFSRLRSHFVIESGQGESSVTHEDAATVDPFVLY
jgi:hypothetical protein